MPASRPDRAHTHSTGTARRSADWLFSSGAEPELRRQLEAKTEADRYHRIKTQIVGALAKFSFLGAHITLQLRAHARWQSSTAMSQQSRAGSLGHHSQIGAEVEKTLHAAVVPIRRRNTGSLSKMPYDRRAVRAVPTNNQTADAHCGATQARRSDVALIVVRKPACQAESACIRMPIGEQIASAQAKPAVVAKLDSS